MTWIVTSLFELILSLLKGTIGLLASNFVGNLGINIGAQFPNIDKTNRDLMHVLETRGTGDGLFDEIFKGAEQFASVFVLMGIVLAFIFGIVAIYSSLVGPIGNIEHPFVVAPRMIVASVACAFSYQIFLIFEYMGQKLLIAFQEIAFTAEVLNPASNMQASAGSGSYGVSKELEKLTTNAFDPDGVYAMIGVNNSVETNGSLLAVIICIVCIFLILINFFKLLLEMVERYAVLGMLFYTCPVAFSTLATKKTSGIFGSWIGMVVSQLILMITNCFFLNTFIGGLVTFGLFNFSKLSIGTYVVYMLLLVGWLKIGQNVDQYLKGLGLSTAQCGGQLSSAVGGAVGGLVASVVRMGATKGMKAVGSKLGEKVTDAKATQAAEFADKQNIRNRQNEYFGSKGNSTAVKDGAKIAKGLENPAAKAEAEKLVKSSAAMPNGGVSYATNDGGGVSVGRNLGKAGVNGVNEMKGGGQVQITKDSPQARKMANIIANGDMNTRAAATKCAESMPENSEVNSYALSGNRGEASVVSSDNGMVAFASSATNTLHPTLQRAGVDTLSNESDGVISVSSHRFDDSQAYVSSSGETLTPLSNGTALSSSSALGGDASGSVFVCAGDINKEGLDFLQDMHVEADIRGLETGWQGANIVVDTENGRESVRGIEMGNNVYKEMKSKGFFERLDENEFVEAVFSKPDVELNPFDFGAK